MKITITEPREVEVKQLQVKANVRYFEDGLVNGKEDSNDSPTMPCVEGDLWKPLIDIETGQILNWRQGVTASIHYKVCDQCSWELKDESGKVVLSMEDDYVPETLYPKENGYGDYIIMDIDENGVIADWDFDPSDFTETED